MVLNSADRVRYGMVAAHRIYLGKNLVWDCRLADTAGSVFVVLSGSGIPSGQTLEGLLLVSVMDGIITALPITAGFDNLLHAADQGDGTPLPRVVDTTHGAGDTEPVLEAFAAGRTYGMVFARGLAEMLMAISGRPHPVDTVHGAGVSDLEDIRGYGQPRPTDVTYGRGTCEVLEYLGGFAVPTPRGTERSAAKTSHRLYAQAATTVKTIWADPVQTDNELYISHVYEATLTDGVLEVT